MSDLDRREADAVQGLADTGAHSLDTFARESAIRAICKKDTDLERAFNYLRGEVLLLSPFMAAKQLLEVLRLLASHWTPQVDDDHTEAIRWLAAEAVSILTLNLVTIAGQATTISRQAWDLLVAEQLAQGAVPAHQMRKLSDAVDKYLAGVLTTAQVPAELRTQTIGAFLPQPPLYTEQFAELCWRLKTEATYARALPRQVDFLAFERLVRRREPHPTAVTRLLLANTNSARLIGLICAFLRGCGGSFEALDQALSASVTRSGPTPKINELRLEDKV
ncbi:hypothetical protein [Actinomadura fibrosa]|uniref:Uncharacterized protein n=1 Tax=Actinomadura fibrosa TaxID=111802 RepID=A0ABW2Y439_9ACTN|nr:hypothetical protein [Actinomadura fibrosa]